MSRIKLEHAVLVEGRYDKIKLDSVLDALIIPVHGFNVFTDKQLKELIKKLAEQRGIVILTDSDAAGFKIRGFIKGLVPANQVVDVFIPDIFGKEPRKKEASKEGKLGVEGVDVETLRSAFKKAGLSSRPAKEKAGKEIQKFHLVQLGLSGSKNSTESRKKIYKELGFPDRISTNAALELLNSMFSMQEFIKFLEKMQ